MMFEIFNLKYQFQIQPAKLVLFFDVSEDTLVKRCLHRAETRFYFSYPVFFR